MNTADQRMASSAQKADETGTKIAAGIEKGSGGATRFADTLQDALTRVRTQYALLTATTDEQSASLTILGTSYERLTAQQQDMIGKIVQQQQAITALTDARKAEIAAAEEEANKTAVLSQKLQQAHRAISEGGGGLTTLVTLPLIGIGKAASDDAIKFDQLRNGLIAVLGSASAADEELARLHEIAKIPGLGFEGATEGLLGLKAAGLSISEAENALRGFGKAVAEIGKGKETFEFVQNELERLAAESKVSGRSILELSRELPQLRQALQAAFGTSDPLQLEKMGIDSKKLIDVVATSFNKIQLSGDSLRNRLDNDSDAMQQSLALIGQPVAALEADLLDGLAPALKEIANDFHELPDEIQEAAVGLLAMAAVGGPVLLLASQFVELQRAIKGVQISLAAGVGADAAAGAAGAAGAGGAAGLLARLGIGGAEAAGAGRMAVAGPVGLAALALLVTGLAGAHVVNQQSDAQIDAAGTGALGDFQAKVADLTKQVADLKSYVDSGGKAQSITSSEREAFTGAGIDLGVHNGAYTAEPGANLDAVRIKLQGYAADLENAKKAVADLTALQERMAKGHTGPVAPSYNEQETEKVKAAIQSLTDKIEENGNKTQAAAMHAKLFGGEWKDVDPTLKATLMHLAEQDDAINAHTKAVAKATEQAKRYADALRNAQRQAALDAIQPNDPHRDEKRFAIEQQYAAPGETFNASQTAALKAQYASDDAARTKRDNDTKTAASIKDVTRALEGQVQELTAQAAAAGDGEKKLSVYSRTVETIQKLLRDHPEAAKDGTIASLIQRAEQAAQQVDAATDLLNATKGLEESDKLGTEANKAGYGQFAQMIANYKASAEVTKTLGEAVGDARARYEEAAGAGDHYLDALAHLNIVTKTLTTDQRAQVDEIIRYNEAVQALETKQQRVGGIASSLASPFKGYFDDLAGGRGKDASKRFSDGMRSQLSGMFADLLGNQVQNAFKHMLDPIYDQLTTAMKDGSLSVKLTLAGMQESVGLMLSQCYGLLSIIGAMGKKSQGGGILGGILGGVIGSLIPGVGTMMGVSIGSSLGGAIGSGNIAQIALAGLSGFSALQSAGFFAAANPLLSTPSSGGLSGGLNGLGSIGGGSSGLSGGLNGLHRDEVIGGQPVVINSNNHFYGDIGVTDVEEIRRQSAKGLQIALRTPAARAAGMGFSH